MTTNDLHYLQSWFSSYCRSFLSDNEEDNRNYRLKEEHTYRVCDNMRILCQELEEMDENQRSLAEAIALFHDVGRFEQYRQFCTFKDSASVNHAGFGAKLLERSGVLSLLPHEESQYVVRAVALHNVFHVPANLAEKDLMFLKLIRDADKLDIWRVFIEHYHQKENERASAVSLGFPDLPIVSHEVLAALMRREMVNLQNVESLNDFKLLQLSWVYDLNFPTSFLLVLQRGYIEAISQTLPEDVAIKEAIAAVERFVKRD